MKEIYVIITDEYKYKYGMELYIRFASESYEKCKEFIDRHVKSLSSFYPYYTKEDLYCLIQKIVLEKDNKMGIARYIE